ncbi:glycosyltransferase family 4 protein [Neobacillus ginsengisoli]|uniref:Glycosyltransferase involved in cell wall biosynthesis n=1 Tax=Neobacillus ginsengisoli TaxID=904295 RepID=A0ABT9Y159_9BACI|nr:glycosyltransferase family 1 protein [Neobacillus ginsengisoli]MDQ0201562.1 glycosyltransferase involved in cell wall biosynthesis [Neobacillus ginsengisoli]
MKLAIFTDTFYPDINGAARTLKRFCHYLDAQNISFKVFAPDSYPSEYASSHIYRLKSLSFFLYPECRLALPNLHRIKSELQSFAPDLIHVATPFNIGLCGVYFAKKLNIPLVGSYHTDFDHYLHYYDLQFLSKILWKYMNWFHRSCEKLFVPSNETLEQLKQHGFSNLEIWPRGVDCQVFHPFYDKKAVRKHYGVSKKYLLTYVGRLAPEKDVHTLLAVAKSLPPELNENIHWFVIGDGPLREELEKEAPLNMSFTGYLKGEKLAEVYSASDLFVFPSATETFGNVVLEALASGTPVIGANAGGVKNIVKPGENGYLCKPGYVPEFAGAIARLLNNESLRKQMGWEGRNYALEQKWDKIFENLLWHYSAVIEEIKSKKYA